MNEYVKTVNQNFTEEVRCPVCFNFQMETHAPGDKFAYLCKNCNAVIEGVRQPHLLQRVARFIAKHGGNCCTGFGGLAGEISHKVWTMRK